MLLLQSFLSSQCFEKHESQSKSTNVTIVDIDCASVTVDCLGVQEGPDIPPTPVLENPEQQTRW